MASNKKYWKSVEELKENSSIVEKLQKSEFIEDIPTEKFLGDKEALDSGETSRRDFLKYVGFSTAVASLAACEGPVVNSIPYVVKPDDLIPGISFRPRTPVRLAPRSRRRRFSRRPPRLPAG